MRQQGNILIIDNASKDGTLRIIEKLFPEVRIIRLAKNIGFGRANNIGIKCAYEKGAEYFFLLNQDAYIACDSLLKLVTLQKDNPHYGILSPLHLDDTTKQLDHKFATYIGKTADKDHLLSDFLVTGKSKEVYNVDFINAAIWLLSRKCIEKVGLFNPSFEHYGEDKDYIERTKYHGFEVGLAIKIFAIHNRLQIKDSKIENDVNKFIQKSKAEIVYRLSRFKPNNLFNFFSSISFILLSKLPPKLKFYEKIYLRSRLLLFIFINIYTIFRNRKVSIKGTLCFFEQTILIENEEKTGWAKL